MPNFILQCGIPKLLSFGYTPLLRIFENENLAVFSTKANSKYNLTAQFSFFNTIKELIMQVFLLIAVAFFTWFVSTIVTSFITSFVLLPIRIIAGSTLYYFFCGLLNGAISISVAYLVVYNFLGIEPTPIFGWTILVGSLLAISAIKTDNHIYMRIGDIAASITTIILLYVNPAFFIFLQ